MQNKILLWSNKQFGSFQPYLTPYLLPGNSVRQAIIILPGGGYHFRAEHESRKVAEKFNELGFHALVLEYRVAPAVYPEPQEDALRAIRIVRFHAKEWSINPQKIAIMGFSAGAHLAGSAGILFDRIPAKNNDEIDSVSARPDAIILGYPVVTAMAPFAHHDSFVKLLGHEYTPEEGAKFSLEKLVRPEMPPFFLWHGIGDTLVPCENSLMMADALRKIGNRVELHIFAQGSHGVDLGNDDCPTVKIWPELCRNFLNSI